MSKNAELIEGNVSSQQIANTFKDKQQEKKTSGNRLKTMYNQGVYQMDTALPASMCDEISNYYYNIKAQDIDMNGVKVKWCNPDDWVGPWIYQYIKQANDHLFQYDIDGVFFNEVNHMTITEGDFHGIQIDCDDNSFLSYEPPYHKSYLNYPRKEFVRKLSFVLQLSKENEYEGGDVVMRVNNINETQFPLMKERGTICVFDSRTRYKLEPVTKGKREVLVGWAIGPRWK